MKRKLARVFGERKSSDRSMGMLELSTYRDYLKSPQWKAIRLDVLTARPNCEVCGSAASQVHHYCYDSVVMAGGLNDLLVSICRDCHELIEFDGDGGKLPEKDARKKLNRTLADRGMVGSLQRLQRSFRSLKKADRIAKTNRSRKLKANPVHPVSLPQAPKGQKRPRIKRLSKQQMILASIPPELRSQHKKKSSTRVLRGDRF